MSTPPVDGLEARIAPGGSAPVRRRPAWHPATVASVATETPNARRIVLDVPTWPGNDPGQHLDLRLTAEDGYQASRSYSIASAGAGTRVTLAVDRVEGGEVSPFLVDAIEVGDAVDVHGPLGGWFVWRPGASDRPVQLIAGGSGIVPLLPMVTAHAEADDPVPFRLLYATRTPEDVFFREELDAPCVRPHRSRSRTCTADGHRRDRASPWAGSHGSVSASPCWGPTSARSCTSAGRPRSSSRCCGGSASSATTCPTSVRSASAAPEGLGRLVHDEGPGR